MILFCPPAMIRSAEPISCKDLQVIESTEDLKLVLPGLEGFRWSMEPVAAGSTFSCTVVSTSMMYSSSPVDSPDLCRQTADTILERIRSVIEDEDQYADDEPAPSDETVALAEQLIRTIESVGVDEFPKTYISVYYGEIDITWKTAKDLVRLMVKPGDRIELYQQPNYPNSPRGESTVITMLDAATVADQIERLRG